MSDFTLRIPKRTITPLFGTAYPYLEFADYKKEEILKELLIEKTPEMERYNVRVTRSVDGVESWIFQTTFLDQDKRKAYDALADFEKYIATLKPLGIFQPPRIWNYIFRQRLPAKSYYIESDVITEVLNWLHENLHHRDYQFYTRFDTGTTVGFKNLEHAAMFSLTFAHLNL